MLESKIESTIDAQLVNTLSKLGGLQVKLNTELRGEFQKNNADNRINELINCTMICIVTFAIAFVSCEVNKMIIEEIQNKAYKTSGKMKAAQKMALAEAQRAQSQNGLSNVFGGGSSRSFGSTTNYSSRGKSGGGKTASKMSSNSGSGSSRSFGATIGYAAQEGKKFDNYEEDRKAELFDDAKFRHRRSNACGGSDGGGS